MEPETPRTVTPVETSQERQGSSLLNALLSPETIRRNVGNIFRPLRPEPKATERTTRVVPKLERPRSDRPRQAKSVSKPASKPSPKPIPKPVHIPVTRHPTMADYSSIAGFHLKFSVHPNKQYAHIQMNSIYGDLFESQRPALQKQNSSPSTSIVVCGTGNMMESRVTQLWFYQSHLLLTKDMIQNTVIE